MGLGNFTVSATILSMIEKEPTADAGNVNEIPSDAKSPWTLNFEFNEDAFLQFVDSTAETGIYFLPIRFRRSGYGPFFMLAEELSFLPEAFMSYQGKIFPNFENQNRAADDPSTFSGTEIKVGRKPDESKYIIKGIPHADGGPDDNLRFISLDIEITRNGDSILTMHDNRRNNHASMEFRTAENGGKYPIMAAVFTRIAERIAKAKRS